MTDRPTNEEIDKLSLPFEYNPYSHEVRFPGREPDIRQQLDTYLLKYNQEQHAATTERASIQAEDNLLDSLEALISQTVSRAEKAYGGCHKCYGKGYRTTIEGTKYMGDDLQYHKMPVRQVMHYCTCDRGIQLERLLERETSE